MFLQIPQFRMKQQEYEEEIYNIINDDQIVFLNVSVSPCTKQFIPKQYKVSFFSNKKIYIIYNIKN